MNLLDKIDWLMKRDGLNRHTLAQRSGIPYTTIVGLYERGYENARLSTLNRLCAFFGVTLDYLVIDRYERPDDFRPNGNTIESITLTQEEVTILTVYRSSTSTGQQLLLTTAQAISGNPDMQKDAPGDPEALSS